MKLEVRLDGEKMNKISFLFAFITLVSTSGAEEISGDGEIVTENPCLNNPCANKGLCITNGITGGYECKCLSGYKGENCTITNQCDEMTVTGNSAEIQPEATECSNILQYTNENNTVNVTFPSATPGTFSSSGETCASSCIVPATKLPIATVECQENGEFGEPIFIDCSAERYELTNDELISYSVAATADPSTITADSATFAIDSTSEAVQNQSSITSTDATSVLYVYNNLLGATDDDTAAQVQDQSEIIVTTINDLAAKVVLDNTTSQAAVGDINGYYINVQANLALAVTDDFTAGDSFEEVLVFSNGQLSNEGNIKEAGLWLTTDSSVISDGATYIKATPPLTKAISDRISFNIYSSPTPLFTNLPNVISMVFSVYGGQEFTFNFNTPTAQNTGIRMWITSTRQWVEPLTDNCVRESANDATRYTCTKEGEYAIVTVDTTDESLSTGEIVGIVIGCVAGVAILGGGLYYCVCYSKKKKKKRNAIAASRDDMKLNEVDDN